MNMREVAADIENQDKRVMAAIERWLAADGGLRGMKVSFEVDGWLIVLTTLRTEDGGGIRHTPGVLRDWHKPTMLDALAHAASYCAVEAP